MGPCFWLETETVVQKVFHELQTGLQQGFLTLALLPFGTRSFFGRGATLGIRGCLAASLASTHKMTAAYLCGCDNQQYLQTLANVLWEGASLLHDSLSFFQQNFPFHILIGIKKASCEQLFQMCGINLALQCLNFWGRKFLKFYPCIPLLFHFANFPALANNIAMHLPTLAPMPCRHMCIWSEWQAQLWDQWDKTF